MHLEVEGAQLLTELWEVFALRINKDNLASRPNLQKPLARGVS